LFKVSKTATMAKAGLFSKRGANLAFTKVALIGEVAAGKAKQVTVNGRTIGIYNVNGTFYAIEDICTHRGAPYVVTCPWHGARFDVTTGSHLSPPAAQGVASYKAQVVGEEIQVDVP
jgi:nitrite reductase/ring-hydroxylating ferredoxin subunit